MTEHRDAIKQWLSTIELIDKSIIDWGSGSKPVFRYIQHTECKFITIDQNPLIVPDRRSEVHFLHDIQKPIDLTQQDIAFCIEVLEHVQEPSKLLENIYWNLKNGGTLYLTAPFQFRIHSEDDYWRYTVHGLRLLLGKVGFTVKSITAQEDNSGYFVEAIK
jgi:hypothetical protein